MKREILFSGVLLSVGLISACGDDSVAVGEGEPFSSLATEPTGEELMDSLNIGVYDASGVAFFRRDPRSEPIDSGAGTRAAVNGTVSQEAECVEGGKVTQTASINQTDENNGSADIRSTFNDCEITMTLGADTYSESVHGSATIHTRISGGDATGTLKRGLSVSGDLGFALECSLSGSGSSEGSIQDSITNGECVFRDSEGTEITVSY